MSTWARDEQDSVDFVLDRALEAHSDRLFLDFSGVEFTYRQVGQRVARVADCLKAHGVVPGDRVMTMLDNSIDSVVTWFGVNRLGAICVPVNTAYRGEFLRHQVADSGARVIIADGHYVGRIQAIADGLDRSTAVFVRDVPQPGDGPARSPMQLATLDFEASLAQASDELPSPVARPSDLSALIYTAGTTGPSKGCMISHNYTMNLTRLYLKLVGRRADERAWNALPLFHFNSWTATVLGSALLGSSGSIAPRFSLSGFWPDIERTGARVATLLGSMASLIAQAEDTQAMLNCKGQLRVVQSAPFAAEDIAVWKERFGVQHAGANGYGLTEAALIVSSPLSESAPPGSSGRLNGLYDVRIFDEEDNEVEPGTPGEIVARPNRPHILFEGYWNRPEATLGMYRSLWLHSGDIGKFDQDGFFYFVDRKKDYLRRRGENISSFEMERAFANHPDVEEVAVHAVPSDIGEDDVKVTVVLRRGAIVSEEELCRWSIERLPYFAVPRYIEFRAELPRNLVGRVLKYSLRDEGVTPGTWDCEASGLVVERR